MKAWELEEGGDVLGRARALAMSVLARRSRDERDGMVGMCWLRLMETLCCPKMNDDLR